jgi:exosortase/archaeosortase family protein
VNRALAQGSPHSFLGFGMRALGLSIVLFGLLRLGWVEHHLLWPFTSLQASLAAWSGGGADTFSRVGLNCSGADAIALCLAFILAWPANWGARIAAAVVGLLFIVGVNIVRIMTLVRLEPSPWFTLLHEYLWPAALTLASAGYVFGWMWWSQRRTHGRPGPGRGAAAGQQLTRFAVATVLCVTAFFATVPLFLESGPVVALAGWMAAAAATVVAWSGGVATATGPVLMTARGGFLVTGECIATPVIPVGVAAALTMPRSWRAAHSRC